MRKRILIALLCTTSAAQAATLTADSPSYVDVKAKTDLAVNGDTVVIPAGTGAWTQTLIITGKNITLQGSTTISGDHLSVDGTTHVSTMSATNATIIEDRVPRVGSSQFLLKMITLDNAFKPRITGITFRYDTTGVVNTKNSNGVVRVEGVSKQFRVDHCHFDQVYGANLIPKNWLYGVIDHNIFNVRSINGEILEIFHDTWGGGSNLYGDGSWAEAANYGSNKFIFIEDNSFNNLTSAVTVCGSMDSWNGGRAVVRYNLFKDTRPGWHGTESGGRTRGGRAFEVYRNIITYTAQVPASTNLGQLRAGSALIHNNEYWGTMTQYPIVVNREYQLFTTWGVAGGNNPIDKNQAGGPFSTGTITSVGAPASGSITVTHATDSSAANAWVGYSINNEPQGTAAYITASTATTITYPQGGSTGTALGLTFSNSDPYKIYKITYALDQTGMGAGDLMKGSPIVNAATGLQQWANQDVNKEPMYAWSNTKNGAAFAAPLFSEYPTVLVDRDFYNRAPQTGEYAFGYTEYTYPHPVIGGATATKVIVIAGNVTFGNVIIGNTATNPITISNTGDTTLTVTNVTSSNAKFTKNYTSGTIAPGASQAVNVTYTPTTETTDTFTLTVTSDATGGTPTISGSGTGVVAGVPPPDDRPYGVLKKIKAMFGRLFP